MALNLRWWVALNLRWWVAFYIGGGGWSLILEVVGGLEYLRWWVALNLRWWVALNFQFVNFCC